MTFTCASECNRLNNFALVHLNMLLCKSLQDIHTMIIRGFEVKTKLKHF